MFAHPMRKKRPPEPCRRPSLHASWWSLGQLGGPKDWSQSRGENHEPIEVFTRVGNAMKCLQLRHLVTKKKKLTGFEGPTCGSRDGCGGGWCGGGGGTNHLGGLKIPGGEVKIRPKFQMDRNVAQEFFGISPKFLLNACLFCIFQNRLHVVLSQF